MSLISLKKKRSLIRYTTIVGIIFTVIASFSIAQSSFFKLGGGFNELLEKLGIIDLSCLFSYKLRKPFIQSFQWG